jgi:two-component system sporulation sensor kinase A
MEDPMISESQLQNQYLFIRVFDNAPIGMALVSIEGRLLKVNSAICNMFGYSEDELFNLTIRELSHPEDIKTNMELRGDAIANKRDAYQMEKRYIHKSGKIIWGLLSVTVERDKGGKPEFFISQLVDITEQKIREEELENIRYLHQLISDHSQDIITRCNPDGIITYVTSAIRTQLGYEPEEVIGRYYHEFWHPEDFTRSLEQGKDGEIICYRVRHKEGHYIWQETHPKVIKNAVGEIQHIIGIARDITERKKMELILQDIEQRYRSLMAYSPVGICSVDLHGDFMEVNPAYEQITGYSAEELLGMHFTNLVFPEHLHNVTSMFEQSLKVNYFYEGFPIQHKNGSAIDAIAWSSPIIINENTAGIYLIIKDITKQKQAEEFLQQAEKLSMIGELAAGIAHEIRNPLTSLRGFIQLFQSEYGAGTGSKNLRYEVMLFEIDRINEIVSELLVLARPSKEDIAKRNIIQSLDHVVTLLEGEANLRNVSITKEFDSNLPLIYSHNNIKQVFVNVLKNAIESMPNGGFVLVQAKVKDDEVCIRFVDQGQGISENQLPRLGQPFYTTKESGTGLGLMICQRIIQNHKGTILFKSEVGRGTVVEILLPL